MVNLNFLKRRRQHGFSMVELLTVMIVGGVIAAMAAPAVLSIARNYRSGGDMRSLGGAVSVAKMRSAAAFTNARVRADLTARTFQIEVWNTTTNTWDVEGGTQNLSKDISFGTGSVTTPPPNTQGTLGQAALCRDNANATIADTACIIFNSRGIPVNSIGTPTATHALYVTDGVSVWGVTVSVTGVTRTWRTDVAAANWKRR